jgi:hypothetical protein
MFSEKLLLPEDCVLEAHIGDDREFRLSFARGGKLLVEFSSAGRYEFKSVEKLRYDFETALEDALRAR